MTDTVTYLWTIQWSWVTFIMGYNVRYQKHRLRATVEGCLASISIAVPAIASISVTTT